jgi:hypothetical protein
MVLALIFYLVSRDDDDDDDDGDDDGGPASGRGHQGRRCCGTSADPIDDPRGQVIDRGPGRHTGTATGSATVYCAFRHRATMIYGEITVQNDQSIFVTQF